MLDNVFIESGIIIGSKSLSGFTKTYVHELLCEVNMSDVDC